MALPDSGPDRPSNLDGDDSGLGEDGMTQSPKNKGMPDDRWAEFDRLRQTAQRYLDETAPHYPAHFDLPVARLRKPKRNAGSGDEGATSMRIEGSG